MEKSRSKKLVLNTSFSVLLQIVNIFCGLILPKLFLVSYGSKVNGLVNSIVQFLGVISLFDLGVGAVIQSALYKPLAQRDGSQISKIYVSAKKYFNKVIIALLVYIILLMLFYPFIANRDFSIYYVDTLIISISITSFAQYYFGIVDTILLNADQKGYIISILNIITLILNVIVCYILIKCNFSIQIVKLCSSLIFLLKPLFLKLYVNKYKINKKIKYNEDPIKQKMNGMAQQISHFILTGTDIIVLTLFSNYLNVSIYTIYNMVVVGVKNFLTSMTTGFLPLMGDMYAKNENKKLNLFFKYLEWIINNVSVIVFGCTAVLIVNFIRIYTKGVTDANYIQPLFGFLITIANAFHCLRLPYNNLIKAAGHYKETQNNYIISMLINIIISIIMVRKFGLIGVSIGTLVSMIYQTTWMAWYTSTKIIKWPLNRFFKQLFFDFLTFSICTFITIQIPLISLSYQSWLISAIQTFSVWIIVCFILNLIFYNKNIKRMLSIIKSRLYRRRSD